MALFNLRGVVFISSLCILGRAQLLPASRDAHSLAAALEEFHGPRMAWVPDAPDPGRVSPRCLEDLHNLLSNNKVLTPALDSFGKPAAGILVGNVVWMGHFDECMAISDFRHCLVGMQANLTDLVNSTLLIPFKWGVCTPVSCSEEDVRNSLDLLLDYLNVTWLTTTNIRQSAAFCTDKPNTNITGGFIVTCTIFAVLVALGLLGSIVDYCQDRGVSEGNLPNLRNGSSLLETQQKFDGLLHGNHGPQENIYEELGGKNAESNDGLLHGNHGPQENIYEELGGENADSNELNNEKAAPTEQSPLLTAGRPASEADVMTVTIPHHSEPNILVRLLLCFAISRNLPKILGTKQGEGGVSCLNGIRVISISWVILGHTLVMIVQNGTSENLLTALPNWMDDFGFQAIANANFAVDSFFFLSGFLLTLLTLRKMKEKDGRIPWAWLYFHRYIRLTPTLGALILVLIYVLPNLGQGPVWFGVQRTVNNCHSYWWTNILYINNFHPGITKDCVEWGWYLANDMQFFVLSPLILLPLFWFTAVGVLGLVTTCLASFITTAILMSKYDLPPGLFAATTSVFVPSANGLSASDGVAYQNKIYIKPYCRIPPYLVGMAMGYIIYRIGKRKIRMSPSLAAAGWAMASGVGIAVVYGLYGISRGTVTPSSTTSAAYVSLSTFAWAVALSWVVFACHYGYGGVIDSFLSWSFWVPLSRLTYSVYLFHPVVIQLYALSLTVPFHWSDLTLSYMFASFLLLSHAVALIVVLFLEFPVGNLEKMLQKSLSSRGKGKSTSH
ncbi:nose resistant to fluoxetine protein 6-like [Diadema setosum]|uniref:nose resistant to fluoxetine protein 6-like n=1 Tax=Diadema setosum TaxID=31175 RepID=UPI003B3B5E17